MPEPSELAFVGTATDADTDGVFGFRLTGAGGLEQTTAVRAGADPMFLTPDPAGDQLYVAVRPDEGGRVVAYDIEDGSGTLTRRNDAPTEGDGTPCYCSVDATDRCVLTAQYGGGSVSVLPITEGGDVDPPSDVVYHEGSGPDEDRQSAPHPHCIRPGPDNRYVYVPDLGTDRVYVYELDPAEGTLTPAECGHVDVQAGAGPRHVEFGPDGAYAYLINELDSTIVAFERNGDTGDLDAIATVSTLPEAYSGENQTADIHVHPSGDYLYGSNRGHDSIAIYELDDTGRPHFIETEPTRGEWPRNFALDPTGSFLFAENADSDTIVPFLITEDGTLEAVGTAVSVPAPVCMRFVGA